MQKINFCNEGKIEKNFGALNSGEAFDRARQEGEGDLGVGGGGGVGVRGPKING